MLLKKVAWFGEGWSGVGEESLWWGTGSLMGQSAVGGGEKPGEKWK